MPVKFSRFARALKTKALDFWGRKLSRGYDPRRTIVVAGTPRGGTTWVAETLAKVPGSLLLWEPLDLVHRTSTLEALGIGYNPYVPPGTPVRPDAPDWPIYEYLKRVLAGQVPFTGYLRIMGWQNTPIRNLLFFQRFVVKFIRGNLLLHWMLTEFGLKGVLIIRHPCAVVSSQLHYGWEKAYRLQKQWLSITEQFDPSISKVIRSVNTTEELLALEWCIMNLVPLRQPKPHPWFLTTYEGLHEDMGEWRKLCDYLNYPMLPKDLIAQPSTSTIRRGKESSPSFSVDKWRRYLSEKQIEDVLRVCSEMGVDFYDKTPYPKNLDNYR